VSISSSITLCPAVKDCIIIPPFALILKALVPLLVIIKVGPPADKVVAFGSVTERFAAVKVTFCTLLEALVSVSDVPCDTVEAPPDVEAGVELVQADPVDVKTLPAVEGAGRSDVDHVDPVYVSNAPISVL
jgi:hypothetical protein